MGWGGTLFGDKHEWMKISVTQRGEYAILDFLKTDAGQIRAEVLNRILRPTHCLLSQPPLDSRTEVAEPQPTGIRNPKEHSQRAAVGGKPVKRHMHHRSSANFEDSKELMEVGKTDIYVVQVLKYVG